MQALPAPQHGGSLAQLRQFVNVRGEDDWVLLLAWLLAALRRRGPSPLLSLCGEQGTAKKLGKLLQRLIDPNLADLRSEPKDPRDLMIAGTNTWLVAYDNLSYLPQWLSDALCRLATGGGFGTRQLYTDDEETLFNAQRPVLLTSITDVVVAGDLLDRTVALHLELIGETARRTEAALWTDFERQRPGILGALLDAVAAGLRNLPSVQLAGLPRMADFALWAEACLRGAGFRPGAFLAAYEYNRASINTLALEASPVAEVVVKAILTDGERFEGTATELLNWLNDRADDATEKQKGWPGKPHLLSGVLRRAAPNLRRVGVSVVFDRSRTTRTITLERAGQTASPASPASSSPDRNNGSSFSSDTCGDDADAGGETGQASPERHPGGAPASPEAASPPGVTLADTAMTLGDAPMRSERHQSKPFQDKELRGDGDAGDGTFSNCAISALLQRTTSRDASRGVSVLHRNLHRNWPPTVHQKASLVR
jgi:hypothetical protein